MKNEYKGIIVEESLIDNRILNDFKIIDVQISTDENPLDRWHIYTITATDNDIIKLSENIKPKWYMHFWKDKNIIAIFQGKTFRFNHDDKQTWEPAIQY